MCVYTYVYVGIICGQKQDVWGLTMCTEKFSINVIYCSVIKFNSQKGGSLCQAIYLGKEFAINEMGEGFVMVSHALSICNSAMQC